MIQLENGNLLSCSDGDKTMNEYQIYENNTYKLISQVKVINDNSPYKMLELETGDIGLVAYTSIIFYSNLNHQLKENYKIQYNDNQIGKFKEMIGVKPGELVLCGNKDKIQFFDLNSKELKEIINIHKDIRFYISNLLCMMNERWLCVGGRDKITIIDVYNKNIIREVEENGAHICLLKLNDNILLTGTSSGNITQWKIEENNLTFVSKKENSHQKSIREIIYFNNFIVSCSGDFSIKAW